MYRVVHAVRKRMQGEEHPDALETASNIGNIAKCIFFQGKHGEAEVMFREAHAMRKRVKGEDMPDALEIGGKRRRRS